MQVAIDRQAAGLKPHLSLVSLFEALLDPIAFSGSLLAVAGLHGVAGDPAYVVLAVTVFLLAQPFPVRIDSGLRALYRGSWLKALVVFSGLALLGLATGYSEAFDSGVLLGWFVFGPLASALLRHAAHALTPLVMARAGYFRHAVIVGASPAGLAVADRIERSRSTGKRLLGFFDDRQPERHARVGIDCLGRIRELADYARSHQVDVIYIALPMSSQPRILQLLDELRDTTASIYFVPDLFMTDLIQARMDDLGGVSLTATIEPPLTGI